MNPRHARSDVDTEIVCDPDCSDCGAGQIAVESVGYAATSAGAAKQERKSHEKHLGERRVPHRAQQARGAAQGP